MPSRRIETRIVVDAPAARVFEILTALDDYPRWNRVLRLRTQGALQAGARAWLHVSGSPLPIPVRIEVVERDRELRWVGGPLGIVRGSHYFELRPMEEKGEEQPARTEVVHAEVFSGVLVPLLWPVLRPQLERLYVSINEGLAAHLRAG